MASPEAVTPPPVPHAHWDSAFVNGSGHTLCCVPGNGSMGLLGPLHTFLKCLAENVTWI